MSLKLTFANLLVNSSFLIGYKNRLKHYVENPTTLKAHTAAIMVSALIQSTRSYTETSVNHLLGEACAENFYTYSPYMIIGLTSLFASTPLKIKFLATLGFGIAQTRLEEFLMDYLLNTDDLYKLSRQANKARSYQEYFRMADIYQEQGFPKKAVEMLDQAEQLITSQKDELKKSTLYLRLSKKYLELNELEKVGQMAQNCNSYQAFEIYLSLARTQQPLQWLKQAESIVDKLSNTVDKEDKYFQIFTEMQGVINDEITADALEQIEQIARKLRDHYHRFKLYHFLVSHYSPSIYVSKPSKYSTLVAQARIAAQHITDVNQSQEIQELLKNFPSGNYEDFLHYVTNPIPENPTWSNTNSGQYEDYLFPKSQ